MPSWPHGRTALVQLSPLRAEAAPGSGSQVWAPAPVPVKAGQKLLNTVKAQSICQGWGWYQFGDCTLILRKAHFKVTLGKTWTNTQETTVPSVPAGSTGSVHFHHQGAVRCRPLRKLIGASEDTTPKLTEPQEQASASCRDGLLLTRAGPNSQGCILSTASHSNMMPSLST